MNGREIRIMNEVNENLDSTLFQTPGIKPPRDELSQANVDEWLDYVFQENGGTSYERPLLNMLRGVRVLGPGNQMAPIPDDTIGLVFVSRPLLNLSDENVRLHPQMISLYNPPKNSIQAYTKGLLDKNWGDLNMHGSGILNPNLAWISPIANLVKVSSGFPDVSLNMAKSDPGIRKQVYQYVNGILKVNYDYDLRMTMHNPKPNILPYLFDMWLHYIDGVTLGDEGMGPYPEALIQNYRDFDCRVYHIILNKNFRNIEGIYCCMDAVPNTFPSGSFSTIDTTRNSLVGQGQEELDIGFSATVFRYNNVRVSQMFNQTTVFFNRNMADGTREKTHRKLSVKEYMAGGFDCYPWINIENMELEYWIKR